VQHNPITHINEGEKTTI